MQPVGLPNGSPVPSESTGTPTRFEAGYATFYAERFAGRRTANGERYDPSMLTAAHRSLPFGTLVEVRRADGRRVVVRVNDRGPFGSNRIIDLSRRAAEELGIVRDGKAWVELVLVADPHSRVEATTVATAGGPRAAPSNTTAGGPKAAPSNTTAGGPKAAPSNVRDAGDAR